MCASCAKEFSTSNFQQKKCTRDCGKQKNVARDIKRANHEIEFIAVDGEGTNSYEYVIDYDDETGEEITIRQRVHNYVLLSVGSESLHNNGEPLKHDEIFAFLWKQFLEHPNAAFVGFFLGYDFTNWLKSIPVHSARSLLTKEGIARRQPKNEDIPFPFPVRDGRWEYINGHRELCNVKWEFDILGTKRFKLRPYVKPDNVPTRVVNKKDGTQVVEKIPRPWMYVCDAGPFFQTSFLNAIHPKQWSNPVVTQDEYDLIERGKVHRQDAQLDDDMITYNLLENEVLARVMCRVNAGFVADGIKLSKNQWFGPGQAAQTWMRNIGVPTGEQIREVVPRWARDAARKTYYGGWFEIFNHGPVPGDSFAYDINSAYPAVIAKLPCLLHGVWTRGTGAKPRLSRRGIRMVYADVKGTDMWVGAMPHRTSTGSILRPRETRGWYWQHEIDAAKRAKVVSRVTVHEWVSYEPCPCAPPMASISELYEGRLTVGKNSPEGKGKKLVYNSAYGKLAQSIGMPKFSNPIYASLITAGCRTMILDAIATHPTKTESLLMIATDGIVFKERHPNLDVHPTRLGAWDEDLYENLSLFMPGLYWDDKTRQQIAENKVPKLKSRGVSARDMATVVNQVDRGWRAISADSPPPKVKLIIEWAMTTAKQAIVRNNWPTCGEIIYGAERTLDGKPDAKRDPELTTAWGGLRSMPYQQADELETAYYERAFGETPEQIDDEGQMVTPDGKIADLQAWAFRR